MWAPTNIKLVSISIRFLFDLSSTTKHNGTVSALVLFDSTMRETSMGDFFGNHMGSREPGLTSTVKDDNNDYCAACGGNGDLLCCDGCVRSFHFSCMDPPINRRKLPETWYCHACTAQNALQPKRRSGFLGRLSQKAESKNPVAFFNPVDIRNFFEGVKTGDEGEFQDGPLQKSRSDADPRTDLPPFTPVRS